MVRQAVGSRVGNPGVTSGVAGCRLNRAPASRPVAGSLPPLKGEATLQPSAHARRTLWRQRELLLFYLLHGDGRKSGEEAPTTEWPTTGAAGACPLRKVARTQAVQGHPHAKLARQSPAQLAEINLRLRCEEHGRSPPSAIHLHIDELQGKTPRCELPQAGGPYLRPTRLIPCPRDLVGSRRELSSSWCCPYPPARTIRSRSSLERMGSLTHSHPSPG